MPEWAGRAKRRPIGLSLLVGGAALTWLACGGEDIAAPTTGSLAITTATSGAEPDPDGYVITIDDGAQTAIGSNATLQRESLEPGEHSVGLTGVAANCAVGGENPRSVTIVGGETANTSFVITCSATAGTVSVAVTTTGASPDPDGYTVSVDGGSGQAIGINATFTFTGVTSGSHQVELSGLAGNCLVDGDNPRAVEVPAGGTTNTSFAITCTATTGTVSVAVTTTGASPDPDGYTVSVDGGSGQAIGINATFTFTGLTSGSHEVELSGLADNCLVDGDNPRMVEIQAGNTATVAFSVTCPAAAVPLIAFTGFVGGRSSSIFVVRPDGQGLTNLTPSGARDALPEWSPDRSRIAFFNIDTEDIWVMNADGSARVNVTHSEERDFNFFVWSPDGSMIAFQINDPIDEPDIWTIRADGSAQTLLMVDAQLPDWSPDGTKIAFTTCCDGGNYQIYSIQSDGGEATRLTNGPSKDTEPVWSPDGSKIAFIRVLPGSGASLASCFGRCEIHVMNADGTGLVNLTNGRGTDAKPMWSPDGRQIVFESRSGDSNSEIYVMNADGSDRTNLTSNPAVDVTPTWSPDGTKIAFMRFVNTNAEIFVMNADGSGQTDVSNHPTTDDITPSWALR